jgi:methionyl-tRNA formyltransferase
MDFKRYNVVYVGLDINTLFLLLHNPKFNVLAVNFNSDFIKSPTRNPFNMVFKIVYWLRWKNHPRYLELTLLYLWKFVHNFTTSIYKKYSEYLTVISKQQKYLLDLSNVSNTIHWLKHNSIDVIVTNNWWILPKEIIDTPKFKSVNIHPSKLPQYRGSLPTLWSLKNHDTISAVSYILLQEKMDYGNIISQYDFQITNQDTAITIENTIDSIIEKTLVQDILDYLKGKKVLTVQNHSKASKTAKYYEYMKIDWRNEEASEIYNKIYLYPYLWPLDKCFTFFKKKKIYIPRANIGESINLAPGEFVTRGNTLMVGTKKGSIVISLLNNLYITNVILLLLNRRGYFQT